MTANRFLCQSEVLILLATKKRSADAVERRVSARRGGRVKKRPLRVRRSDEQTLAVGQLSYFPHATIRLHRSGATPSRARSLACCASARRYVENAGAYPFGPTAMMQRVLRRGTRFTLPSVRIVKPSKKAAKSQKNRYNGPCLCTNPYFKL
jgi:hypothetical protein